MMQRPSLESASKKHGKMNPLAVVPNAVRAKWTTRTWVWPAHQKKKCKQMVSGKENDTVAGHSSIKKGKGKGKGKGASRGSGRVVAMGQGNRNR